jgi:preprotein translocase subunit SecD
MRRGLLWSLAFIISAAVISLGVTVATGHRPLLGLDLKGGVSVVLRPDTQAGNATLQSAVSVIDRRVNELGVSNSSVARQGNDIVISLPGIKDAQHALAVLGQTATANFRPVICQIPAYSPPAATRPTTPTSTPTPATTPRHTANTKPTASEAGPADARLAAATFPAATSATTVPSPTSTPATTIVPQGSSGTPVPLKSPTTAAEANAICAASNSSQVPTTAVEQNKPGSYVILPYYQNPSTAPRYVLGPADMGGNGVKNASVIIDQAGQYQVQLNFTGKGSTEFDKIASQRYPYYQRNPTNPPYQSLEAFELDGVVYSAPTIQANSFNGTAVISGSTNAPFTYKQASDLATNLKSGSLPVRFTPQSVQTVSATIGKDSLKAGLLAGIGGIVIVLLYMIIYYRALGLIVVVGLAIGGALLYGIITLLSTTRGLTLTLAGVVGIIVSVGITVDSYVVYFERLKDEVRAGRTIRQSVDRSFARAFRTVLTADAVAFLAAFILWAFTVGDVRGFAFMLGLSTLLDVFTAFFFIRPAVILVGRRRGFTDARIIGVGRGLGARTTVGET